MRKNKINSPDVMSIAKKRRHLYLLEKIRGGRPLSSREVGELAKLEGKTPKSYEQRVQESLDRKNQATLTAQDIGEMPAVVNPTRKAATLKSFRLFCESYFPEAFYLEWSKDHLRVIDKIEAAVTSGGLFAFAMPRGSGKTTLTMVAAIWAIFTGIRSYVCMVGSAVVQSMALFHSVQASLLGNQLLLDDFPEIVFPIRKLENNSQKQRGQRYKGKLTYQQWGSNKIVFPTLDGSASSGHVITVTSLDSNIRGQNHTTIDGKVLRPDLVLVDDPQTRESAMSPAMTSKRLEVLNGDVLGLAGPGKKISGLLTCTKIYDNDLADQILNRKKNPYWQGECTKMLYKFPTNIKLWDEYSQIRAESFQSGGNASEGTAWYAEHREAMDEGAEVAWPQRKQDDELSALQHAMNLYYRNAAAFMAEYQNEPTTGDKDDILLTVDDVMAKVNDRKRGEIPLKCQYLTMFCDVHDTLIYYCVCAWEDDFTGYIVDYGTYPEQKRLIFTMKTATRKLSGEIVGAGIDAAIQSGLNNLITDYLARNWHRTGGATMRIDRGFIDGGYKPGIVENVRRKVGNIIMSSRGVGLKAASRPMSSYIKKPGERYGFHWYIPNVNKTNEFPYVAIDVNFWKTFVQERLKMAPGDKGSMTIFGNMGSMHSQFAEHIANSEFWVRTQGHGRTVHEWTAKVGRPDNHWFDCLVGCACAAAMCGCKVDGQALKTTERKQITLSELQKQRRDGMQNYGR